MLIGKQCAWIIYNRTSGYLEEKFACGLQLGKELSMSHNPKNLCFGASLDTPTTVDTQHYWCAGGYGDQGPFWRPGPLHAWSKVIWVSSKQVHCHVIYSSIHSFIHSTTSTYCTTVNKINKTSIRGLSSNTSSFYCGTVYGITFLNRLYSWKLTSTKIFSTTSPRGTQE